MEPAAIAAGLRAGDEAAAVALYREMRRRLYYPATQQVGWDALDCLHDAYIAVVKFTRSGKLRQPESILGLAAVVMQRSIQQLIRDRVMASKTRLVEDTLRSEADIEGRLLASEREALAVQAIATLPPWQQKVIRTSLVERDVAAAARLGMTENGYAVAKHRAKRNLLYAIRRFYQRRK